MRFSPHAICGTHSFRLLVGKGHGPWWRGWPLATSAALATGGLGALAAGMNIEMQKFCARCMEPWGADGRLAGWQQWQASSGHSAAGKGLAADMGSGGRHWTWRRAWDMAAGRSVAAGLNPSHNLGTSMLVTDAHGRRAIQCAGLCASGMRVRALPLCPDAAAEKHLQYPNAARRWLEALVACSGGDQIAVRLLGYTMNTSRFKFDETADAHQTNTLQSPITSCKYARILVLGPLKV